MTTNIGSLAVSLSLNASNFNGSMAQVDRNLRTMGSELKAVKALGADYGKSLDGLRSKNDILNRSMEAANIKLTETRKKYDEMKASGTASEAQLERQARKVNEAQAQYNRLATELGEVEREMVALERSSSGNQFNQNLDKVNRNLSVLSSELAVVDSKGQGYSRTVAGLTEKQQLLTKAAQEQQSKIEMLSNRYDELARSGNASEEELHELTIEINEARAEYNRLESELDQVNNSIQLQTSSWHQLSERLAPIGERLTKIGQSMTNVGRTLSMRVTAPLMAMGTGAFKAAVDFESAFAGVRKTVDATEEEFSKLEQGIRDMAKAGPSSASELSAIAEAAGQLGIKTENILKFTSTMSDLGTATNMTSEQAATSLARLANITQMPQSEFDRLGSTIVALGNNLATTESEITEFGLRIAGAGAQVGLTEAQILSVGAALSSVGINAEAGGTAISKVMIELANSVATGGKGLDKFSKVAGMSSAEFKKAFEQDAATAIVAFVEGLGRMSKSGENVFAVMEDLGLSEVRVRDALLRASGAGDLLRESLDLGTKAWDENNALTNEAAQRYKTTASQMKTLWNQIVDVGISLGEILIPKVTALMEKLKPLIERFANMSTESQNLVLILGGVAAAIGPLLVVGGTLMSGIGGLVTTVSTLSGAIAAAGGASAVFGGALAALTGPIGLTVAAVAGIGIGAVALGKHLSQDVIPEVDRFGEGVSDATKKALEGYFELSDGASQKLMELKLSNQTVTEEIKNSLVEQYSQMNEQILAKMEERHSKQMESLQNYFANSYALTEEEENRILQIQQMRNDNEVVSQEHKEARIKEILEKASAEKRALTDMEKTEINTLQQQMNENAVKYLSENEVEAKVILERMKQTAGDMTALQAAEVVKNSNEQKEKAVKAANEQYDQTIAEIIRMRDEAGIISEEQADKLIQEAGRQRDDTVRTAEEMHKMVVNEAKAQAEEHIDTVDWSTGEILSKWDVFWNDTEKMFKNMGKSISKGWDDFWDGVKKGTDEAVEDVKEICNGTIEFFKELPGKMVKLGKDIIQGLIDGISSLGQALWDKATSIASSIGDAIKKTLDINSPSRVTMRLGKWTGEGLELGLESTISNVEAAASKLASASVPAIVPSSQGYHQIDNSRHFKPSIKIYTTESGERTMSRTLRRLAFEF